MSWYQGRRIQAGQIAANADGDSPVPHPHSPPLQSCLSHLALEIILRSATETNHKIMSEAESQHTEFFFSVLQSNPNPGLTESWKYSKSYSGRWQDSMNGHNTQHCGQTSMQQQKSIPASQYVDDQRLCALLTVCSSGSPNKLNKNKSPVCCYTIYTTKLCSSTHY